MARRRSAAGRRYLPFAILAIAGGLVIGLILSRSSLIQPPALPSRPPAAPPTPIARPAPVPPVRNEVVTVDDTVLAAAVSATLAGAGKVETQSDVPQSVRIGEVVFRWHTRRVDLHTRHAPDEVARLLEPALARAGGRLFSRGDLLTFGIVRNGRRFVTHELRLVRPVAAARVAVIFDDAGGSLEDVEAIIALGRPVTIAVLPGLRFSRDVAERTRAAGLEVFLHLPIEADPPQPMGPGGIAVAMTDEEIAVMVRDGLDTVPGAIGVNNHMGSRGTADARVMRAVLGVVKARGLIWVDSRTTIHTVGAELAGQMGIPTASRQVFLDNDDRPEAIRVQITRLIEIARRNGEAIAIGHAHRRTAQVLREMLSEFDHADIELVPASGLAR
ncbi:MAG TPA: divergent polysaccharide deacetylase family protein [bacterium]